MKRWQSGVRTSPCEESQLLGGTQYVITVRYVLEFRDPLARPPATTRTELELLLLLSQLGMLLCHRGRHQVADRPASVPPNPVRSTRHPFQSLVPAAANQSFANRVELRRCERKCCEDGSTLLPASAPATWQG